MPNHGTYFFFILRIRRPPKSPLFPYATLSRSLGYRLIALPGVYCHALLAAARGEAETTRRLTDDLTTWAAPRGAKVFGHFAARARALSALGGREFEEAYRLLSGISPAGRLVSHVPVAMRAAGDLVAAAV